MSNNDEFPHPLDVDIEETIPVKKFKFDPKTKRTTSTYELEKVTTRYMEIPYEKYRCKTGEHTFKCVDNTRYIFSCVKCPFSRKVYPTSYEFIKGKLISKTTGRAV